MRVFVTGASGFIGGVVCRRLLGEGHEVHALVRRAGSAPEGTEAVPGDLLSDGLGDALAGCAPECVIHLAAEIASQREAHKVRAVNVEGTRRLLDGCLALALAGGSGDAAQAPRFVFASTVVTGQADGNLLTEESVLPVQTAYGRSKQEGEELVLDSGLPAVVLRPSHVYGPGGWYIEELVARLRAPGRFAVIGSGSNLWDVVHVEDVAEAILLACGPQAPSGSIFHVADDEPITYYDFMALTARELGLGAPRRIPAALARIVAGSAAVDAVVRSARSSNALIKRELGWKPRFPTAREGVPDALAGLLAG